MNELVRHSEHVDAFAVTDLNNILNNAIFQHVLLHKKDGDQGCTDDVLGIRRWIKLLDDTMPHNYNGSEQSIATANVHKSTLHHFNCSFANGVRELFHKEVSF